LLNDKERLSSKLTSRGILCFTPVKKSRHRWDLERCLPAKGAMPRLLFTILMKLWLHIRFGSQCWMQEAHPYSSNSMRANHRPSWKQVIGLVNPCEVRWLYLTSLPLSLFFQFQQVLFRGKAAFCGRMCYELLRCCNSHLQPVRIEACITIYFLMRANYEFTKKLNFTRVKLQVRFRSGAEVIYAGFNWLWAFCLNFWHNTYITGSLVMLGPDRLCSTGPHSGYTSCTPGLKTRVTETSNTWILVAFCVVGIGVQLVWRLGAGKIC